MFHYGLTALPDMGIKNTKEKEDFLRAAWKLDETINTDNYADTVNALDTTGFKEYYNLIGAFAKKYNIANWQDYNEYEPVLIEHLNEELGRHEKTEQKLELINSFHDEELQSEKFLYEAKEKFIKDILDEFAVFNPKEQSINRILKTFTESEKRKFTAFLFDNNQLYLNKILSKINGKEYKKLITLLDFDRKEIDFKSYKKSWIVVKNESGLIEKIIYNAGSGITFVNIYGEILEEIPFDTAYRKTEFLNKYLGIGNSGDILIKAGYSYKDGIFIGNDKAKRAFDLNGNEASLDFQYRKKNKKALLSSENIDISKKQKEPDFFKQVWETLFESKTAKQEAEAQISDAVKNEEIKKLNEENNYQFDDYYKTPKTFIKKFNPEVMKAFEKGSGYTKCNEFLEAITNNLSEDIAKKILPNGLKLAAQLYQDWKSNPNLICINPKSHFDNTRSLTQLRKDAAIAAQKANDMANQGYFVLAASPDFQSYTAHVSCVIAQDNIYTYDADENNIDQTCFLNTNGYTGHQDRVKPEVVRDYPLFLQAGNSTGVVPPGWAFSRSLFDTDKVDYYVVKN